jgi:hypothetical protein
MILMTDLSQASANAMLTARATKVLSRVIRGDELDAGGREVARDAAEFLGKIVEGSLLIEGREVAGFAPSHENLREYVRALSALQTLDQVSKDTSSGGTFVNYRSQLLAVADQQAVDAAELKNLRRFFDALSAFFFSDLTRPAPPRRGNSDWLTA